MANFPRLAVLAAPALLVAGLAVTGTASAALKPGDAARTAGIEFTAMDAVAMSPCTPPSMREWIRGEPSIRTDS